MKVSPESNVLFSISSKRSYETCPRQYAYKYVDGYVPKEASEDLERGTQLHKDFELVYSGKAYQYAQEGPSKPRRGTLSSAGQAYYSWHREHDDFLINTAHVEMPLLLSLQSLREDICVPETWKFGGVIDATILDNQGRWLVDHKTVERFYGYPEHMYIEQLGLYAVALEKLTQEKFVGYCINRVKLQPRVNAQHFKNYYTKFLKEKCGFSLTKADISKLLTNSQKCAKIQVQCRGKYTLTLTTETSNTIQGIRAITLYNQEGQLQESIAWYSNTLVHVQRDYKRFSPERLQSITQAFMYHCLRLQADSKYDRTPGYHCGKCPYQKPCWEQWATQTDSRKEGMREDYKKAKAHPEITTRLHTVAKQKKTC